MKIERINENSISLTMNREELVNRNLKLADLSYGSEKARELLVEMINLANAEIGFKADSPLAVEAVPLKDGDIKLDRFFKMEFASTKQDMDKIIKDIEKAMEDSVKHHEIADVEVGSFLSSGIDSSYLVSLARPNKTYTVGGLRVTRINNFDNNGDQINYIKYSFNKIIFFIK